MGDTTKTCLPTNLPFDPLKPTFDRIGDIWKTICAFTGIDEREVRVENLYSIALLYRIYFSQCFMKTCLKYVIFILDVIDSPIVDGVLFVIK